MSARINGIINTNNDVNIENNMKVLPLVREEYYLTLEAFNKLELSKDISFVGNDVSFNANISVSGNIIPLGNTSQLGSNNKYWNSAYVNNLHVNNFVNTINASYLTDNTITSAKITNSTITSDKIASNTIVNNNISLNAQILFSKINATNAIMNSDISANASIAFNKINTTNAIMNKDISANASIAFNKINTTNAIMDRDISANASIAFNKINTTNAIMDSDISSNASIAFSKINTTNAIMDTDISANALIAFSKINTTNAIMDLDISSNASIAFSKINTTNVIMDSDISSNASIAFSKINTTNAIMDTDISSSASIAFSKINTTNVIMDSDISANADISGSKIANTSITSNKINSNGTWRFLNIDVSFGNITDISVTNISISGNLIPLNNIRSDLGSSSNYWHNAYIDNIDVSSHIRIGQGHFGGKILSTSAEHELIIDPHGFDFPYTGNDASGRVVILGDLIVRGDTTTINSASIDISDLILNIASNATRNNVFGIESGIELGSDKYATLLYNRVSNSWKTNIGLEISGAITLSGNLVSLSNSSQLGSSNNYWSNAYITNLNVTNFVNTIDASYLTDNTITSAKIANGTIVNNDISSNAQILFSKIDATNAIIDSDISTNANIAFSKIDASNAIIDSDIFTNANIKGSKIADASIASSKINSSGTWSFTNISANFGNIYDLSVNNSMTISGNLEPLNPNNTSRLGNVNRLWSNAYIRDLSATNISISGSVTIPDGTINGSKIVTGTITSTQIASGTITSTQIASGTITSTQIVSGTITSTQIASGTITSTQIASGTITSTQIADGTIVDGDISSNASIAFNKINATNNITNLHIASNADISGSKIANVSITSNKIDSSGTWSFTNISGNFGTIRDLSVNNNMTISGNLEPLNLNNTSRLGNFNRLWSNAYIRDLSATNISISGTVSGITKTMVGLGNVDNTTDENKPLSAATRGALDLKANLANPTFSGTVTIQNISASNISVSGSISVSGNIVPLNNNNSSDLGLVGARWNNLFVRNIDVSGDISNVRDICNARQIIPRPTSDISTSLGTSSNIWQRAFISDLSGITRINGATWPLNSGTSDFSGLDINTNLVPRNPLALDLGTQSKYWRNAYIQDISITNISVSGNFILNISGTTTNVNTRLSTIDSSFININTRLNAIDTSFTNVNTRLINIDTSFTNVNTRLINIDSSFANVNTRLSTIDSSFGIVNTRLGNIDTSFTTLLRLRDLSVNNSMTISGNLIPLAINNNSTLGSTTNLWRNAYIQDISITNMSISGNFILNISGTTSNVNTRLINIDTSFTNVNTRLINIDTSFTNVNTRLSTIDTSFANVNTRLGTIDTSFTNVNTRLSTIDTSFTNVNTRLSTIDTSFANVNTRLINIDTSFTTLLRLRDLSVNNNMSISGNLEPLNLNNTSRLGNVNRLWSNAYIRDLSVANISVSGSVNIPDGTINGSKIASGTITSNKINSSGTWNFNSLALTGSIIPSSSNQGSVGESGFRWQTGFINNITATNITPTSNGGGSLGINGTAWNQGFINNITATSITTTSITTNNINGSAYSPITLTAVTSNIVPSTAGSILTLGSTTNLWRNAYIQDISVANISVSGNILSTNNNSQVPVSYNTFSVVSAQNRTLPSYIDTTSANVWVAASAYDISKVVLSNRSFIKIEVKVNYTASPEADQTLSFRVMESFNRGISFETIPVFSDISLGSSMGVTINNIYNGSYYDDLSGVTLSGNIITYRLEFRRDCPVGNTIKTPGYGIQQSTGNYISLQELYRP